MRVIISNREQEILSDTYVPPQQETSYRQWNHSGEEQFWNSHAHEISYGSTHIARHRVKVLEDVWLRTSEAPRLVSLFFVENGVLDAKSPCGYPWSIGTMQHSIVYNAYDTAATLFRKQEDLRLSIVSFSPEHFLHLCEGGGGWMENMASDIAGGRQISPGEMPNMQLDIRMVRLLQDLSNPAQYGAAARLMTESKVLELLALQVGQMDREKDLLQTNKLTQSDVRKLHAVHDRLLSDITGEYTLDGISREAGLNVYKLKYGFKTLFGQPVFRFLKDKKLEYAAEQIRRNAGSLTDIAYDAGFSTLSHFSDAFKKKYGVSPGKSR